MHCRIDRASTLLRSRRSCCVVGLALAAACASYPFTAHAGTLLDESVDFCLYGPPTNFCDPESDRSTPWRWEIREAAEPLPIQTVVPILPPEVVEGVRFPGTTEDLRDAWVESINAATQRDLGTSGLIRTIRAVSLEGADVPTHCQPFGLPAFRLISEVPVELLVSPAPTSCGGPPSSVLQVGEGCPGAIGFNPFVFAAARNGSPVPEPTFPIGMTVGASWALGLRLRSRRNAPEPA